VPNLDASALLVGQPPANILDLFAEFREPPTNGIKLDAGSGLIGALTYFGLDSVAVTEKEEMVPVGPARWPLVNGPSAWRC